MSSSQPEQYFGRYRVHDVLGRGGFGTVYLGFDEELHRKVAVKVPHPECIRDERDIEAYISEARLVAQLEHDGIASVHDVGRTENGECYVVSRFIDGESLASRIRTQPPNLETAVCLVISIAETLDYVHQQGIVHRDIKPGNILLSIDERAYVTDFGLALRDHQLSGRLEISGTPKYMSPEQARGESHLVDGRSDIFSLGIVLYKMLTGVNPFDGVDTSGILEAIIGAEPRMPRELNPLIPIALQRVCLKTLAKPISQRYAKASLLAADLRQIDFDGESAFSVPSVSAEESTKIALSGDRLMGVVPKGLRSFDVADARFFMKLLPGPVDAAGLPESIHFWKSHIDSRNADETFRVGVIYGPSGCGKSSLVKAGLLPMLDEDVEAIFVEAAPDQTEKRLLARIKRASDGVADGSLKACLQALRTSIDSKKKILIVIDQFEQWLHAVTAPDHSELANALRQCDGAHVQCILLVRDDFWLAVSRFMACLDIDLAQNQNMRLVDLFDPIHSRRVLAEFGCGYGRLPENFGQLTDEQNQFLDAAVEGLLQNDKVIPIRLALFAEMVKGRPWTLSTLRDLGGIEGVGARFLEECFENSTAPAEQRVHKVAVHRTLRALLPDVGTDIKGSMKSYGELLEASGYAEQPDQFRALVRILDSNLRLITPTDPMGLSPEDASGQSGMRYYQLTHDFLVPAIRERLTADERSSRRGRAELLLRDLSGSWSRNPDRRSLPGWLEWIQIQLFTDRKRWTDAQKKVIAAATRRNAIIAGLAIGLLFAISLGMYQYNGSTRAEALVAQLSTATTEKVPAILENMKPYRAWVTPGLKSARARYDEDSRARLFLAAALADDEESEKDFLRSRLLKCSAVDQPLIMDAMDSEQADIVPELWSTLQDPSAEDRSRLLAALALAQWDPPSNGEHPEWSAASTFVAERLIDSATYDRQSYPTVMAACQSLASVLAKPLGAVVADKSSEAVPQATARQLLIDLLAESPEELVDQILDATPEHVVRSLPVLDKHRAAVVNTLNSVVAVGYEETLTVEEWLRRANRQANAAALLLRYRESQHVWNILRRSAQPDAGTYLIHRVKPLGVDPIILVARLKKETDSGIRNGLMLSLGEYELDELTQAGTATTLDLATSWYANDPDASVHGTTQWLLRKWKGNEYLNEIEVASDGGGKATEATPTWRHDPNDLVMVTLKPPSNVLEAFELSTTEVSCELVWKIDPNQSFEPDFAPTPDCAAISMSWFDVVEFCQKMTLHAGMSEDDLCYESLDSEERYRLKEDYRACAGYRLPTQAEWEFALRGGAESTFHFGNDVWMIGEYEWIDGWGDTPSRPGGLKKPNPFGLFDTNGNLSEWCSDPGLNTGRRPLRGGRKTSMHVNLQRDPLVNGIIEPRVRFRSHGFRVARSLVEQDVSE